MIEQIADALDFCTKETKIDNHLRRRVGRTADEYLSVICVPVNAPTRLPIDLPMQSVRRFEVKFLTKFVAHLKLRDLFI